MTKSSVLLLGGSKFFMGKYYIDTKGRRWYLLYGEYYEYEEEYKGVTAMDKPRWCC